MTINDEIDEEIVKEFENAEQPENDAEQETDCADGEYIEEKEYSLEQAVLPKKRSKIEIAINIALWIAIVVLLVAVGLRLFVFSSVEVDGASMNPTYSNGDVVVANKIAKPNRGDVVVFYKNEVENKFAAQFAKREECAQGQPYEKLIKRVVALEGDKIWVQRIADSGDDVMYEVVIETVNGDTLFENCYVKNGEVLNIERFYLHSVALTDLGLLQGCTQSKPFVVSEGCFFAMGDNRVNSQDSRKFGEFKYSQIFGVVLDK